MKKSFTIDAALPAPTVTKLAQQAGDAARGWRRNGDLSWKVGSQFGLKAPAKVRAEITPKGDTASALTITISRFGLADPFGLSNNDYRDFYDQFERLMRAEMTRKAAV
ncbi:MAG: hypothetical protein R3320_11510 [Nitriliruptorales bacterium]|nr:hypothetical protein [Nitriliruptorales bacterium]